MSPPKKPRFLRKCLNALPTDYLRLLLKTDNDSYLECICDETPQVKKLKAEHDRLQEEVANLRDLNHACEPQFVRNRRELRNIVDEVDELRKNITTKYLQPIFDKVDKVAKRLEEDSEKLAQQFLDANLDYDTFIVKYKEIRTEATRNRVLADKLRERGLPEKR